MKSSEIIAFFEARGYQKNPEEKWELFGNEQGYPTTIHMAYQGGFNGGYLIFSYAKCEDEAKLRGIMEQLSAEVKTMINWRVLAFTNRIKGEKDLPLESSFALFIPPMVFRETLLKLNEISQLVADTLQQNGIQPPTK